MNKQEFGLALKQMAEQAWANDKRPFMLSRLPAELKKRNPSFDYKTILDGKSLKQFIQAGKEHGIELAMDPLVPVRVGMVPVGQTYSFEVEREQHRSSTQGSVGSAEHGIELMKALARLSDADLEHVTIPVSVLARLFR